ncbi:MAG: glycosyltransferase family 2 protein [Chitinophagaceae bacterium]
MNGKMALKISIITVVYNCEKTIERTIQSVLGQTYSNIEYIIIDGASKDNTLEQINKYRDHISLIVSEKDNGMYDALNKGIKLSTGDIVGVLHADDEFAHKGILDHVADVFQFNHNVDCLYGDAGFISKEKPWKIIRYYSSAIFKPGLFKYGFMPAHTTFFCYKKYFDLHGYYRTDMNIAADFDLLLRFLKTNQLTSYYLKEMMVKMNLGGKSTNGINSTITINKEIKKILSEHKIASSYLHLYLRYFIKVQEFWKNKKQFA